MVRLFVAAWPSADLSARLATLPRLDERGVRPVAPANWHITLRFLGEIEPDDVQEVRHRLDHAALAATDAVLGPRVERLGRGQLVIPVAGVDDLAAAVRESTCGIGLPDQHRFAGHLTVARTKHDARSALFGTPFHATMPIDEIALVESTLEPTGAVYATIASFPTAR
jgi:RNA 2',3'-cyclic 3'-phosphodiesterase